jgi:hypothetical protein
MASSEFLPGLLLWVRLHREAIRPQLPAARQANQSGNRRARCELEKQSIFPILEVNDAIVAREVPKQLFNYSSSEVLFTREVHDPK